MTTEGLFTWSGGPRSSGVGVFCFHALGDTKQNKLTPLDRESPTPCKQGLSYTFYGGNVVCVLVHFFFTAAHFHLALVAAYPIWSPPLQNFHAVLPTKKFLLCFLSLALDLGRPSSR